MEGNGTQGVASLDPRGMVGRIYVGDLLAVGLNFNGSNSDGSLTF